MHNQFNRVLEGKGQNVTLGAASVQSTAIGAQTFAIRLASTGNCHVEIGTNPTATAASTLIASGNHGEVFQVTPGSKVAVIQDASATGILNIQELSS